MTTTQNFTRPDGKATVWTLTATGWVGFMVLPVVHAAGLAETLRAQGRRVRVTF